MSTNRLLTKGLGMKYLLFKKQNRQKGLALILAIGFLAILSILGAVVMDVATNDLKNSSSHLPQQQAFYEPVFLSTTSHRCSCF